MQKKKLVVANWKMNPLTLEEAKRIFSHVKRTASRLKQVSTVICPPALHFSVLSKLSLKSRVSLGVQDVFWENHGVFTGQISPKQAFNAGARYVIVGHSEKRALGETNEQVAKKLFLVTREGMKGILCIGESQRDKEGDFFASLKDQLLASLSKTPAELIAKSVIIAYEPVWAISRPGSSIQTIKPTDVHETAIFIKKVLNDSFGPQAAAIPVLYGGSVNTMNCHSLVFDGGVDGLLVGGQSLDPSAFSQILTSVAQGNGRKK